MLTWVWPLCRCLMHIYWVGGQSPPRLAEGRLQTQWSERFIQVRVSLAASLGSLPRLTLCSPCSFPQCISTQEALGRQSPSGLVFPLLSILGSSPPASVLPACVFLDFFCRHRGPGI